MSNIINLTGKRFGKLVVIERSPNNHRQEAYWKCKCDCGGESLTPGWNLRSGKTISCGCHGRQVLPLSRTTHGKSHTAEYKCWSLIRNRCFNSSYQEFHLYGGRGVTVCQRWESFELFYADMGLRPGASYSIDRFPNPSGNYEPGNCRWATPAEQARNRRSNWLLSLENTVLCAGDVAKLIGIKPATLCSRLRKYRTVHRSGKQLPASCVLRPAELDAFADELRRVAD